MIAPLPSHKSHFWVCKECHWKQCVGNSDCIIKFSECPKCQGDVELVVKTTIPNILPNILKILR